MIKEELDIHFDVVNLVHCVRCGNEYPPGKMILVKTSIWYCPIDGCHGIYGAGVVPVTIKSE